ncbi:MAG: twin-arginine translocation signal domain-containing protein, partial [Vicinamibacterales bacterium]
MTSSDGVTRREFVTTVGGAAVGTALVGSSSVHAQAKRRYAIIGTGVRAIGMWGRPVAQQYADVAEFVG